MTNTSILFHFYIKNAIRYKKNLFYLQQKNKLFARIIPKKSFITAAVCKVFIKDNYPNSLFFSRTDHKNGKLQTKMKNALTGKEQKA
ncbi:hypothetical protein BRW84_01410 [Oxalobacter formigenes OXCC13]|nr:hypothetical protein BRW83_0350 [Oxalobacter formigenes]ARQ77427.1 hypothetical protein BRW84_01410 [Oxalobacter formigenes OXCC13]